MESSAAQTVRRLMEEGNLVEARRALDQVTNPNELRSLIGQLMVQLSRLQQEQRRQQTSELFEETKSQLRTLKTKNTKVSHLFQMMTQFLQNGDLNEAINYAKQLQEGYGFKSMTVMARKVYESNVLNNAATRMPSARTLQAQRQLFDPERRQLLNNVVQNRQFVQKFQKDLSEAIIKYCTDQEASKQVLLNLMISNVGRSDLKLALELLEVRELMNGRLQADQLTMRISSDRERLSEKMRNIQRRSNGSLVHNESQQDIGPLVISNDSTPAITHTNSHQQAKSLPMAPAAPQHLFQSTTEPHIHLQRPGGVDTHQLQSLQVPNSAVLSEQQPEGEKKEQKNHLMNMSNSPKKGKDNSSPEIKNNTLVQSLFSSTAESKKDNMHQSAGGKKEKLVAADPDRGSKQTYSMKTSGSSGQSKMAIPPIERGYRKE